MSKCQITFKISIVLILFTFINNINLNAQDFMMQGWYWDYPKTANGFNWADTLESKASALGQAGFNYIWLPPLSRASFGSNSNGYDPQDLYDLGIPSEGPTGFGTRPELDAVISAFNNNGILPVADVVYNHRDGGAPEDNPSVEGWIENYNCTKANAGDNAYPSDRFRCYLPLGGATGNGAGTYYFKLKSASLHPNYYGKEYKLYMETNTTGFQNLPEDTEDESGGGNGGGDCGQGNNTLQLGVDMVAFIDDVGSCSGSCGIDEFQVTIGASDYNASGDTLWIYMTNPNGNYSDHYISGLWDGSADIQSQIKYQTYTDFTNMPSGRGGMDHTHFKPNGNPTQLNGDWDWMWFFYDYDQRYNQATKDTLNVWSKWLWDEVGIRGFRMDAIKHFNHEFTGDLMDYLHDNGIDPGMVVGEFFDNNAAILTDWVTNVESFMDADTKANINVRVFDFALRAALKDACDAFGYDARNVFNSGMVESTSASGFNTVTFINNHDFRDAGQPVQNDPVLGYAYILTNNQVGLPCVFYPDYYEAAIPNAPSTFLKDEIDALISVHQDYIYQSNSVDYLNRFGTPYSSNYAGGFDNTTLLYQLSGGIAGKEVIVAINFAGETLRLDHGINTSNLAVGDTLKDVIGNSNFPYALVSGSNQMYIELPARSYSVWVSEPALAPLPVELSTFQIAAQQASVALNWTSWNEVNFDSYAIQRSVDGINYENIGTIKGQNKTSYTFEDLNPLYNQTLYYRLKLLDQDGKFAYSAIQTTILSKTLKGMTLSPNPAGSWTNLSFESLQSGTAVLTIFDVEGKELCLLNQAVQDGDNIIALDLKDFPKGVYTLEVQLAGVLHSMQLVKQ